MLYMNLYPTLETRFTTAEIVSMRKTMSAIDELLAVADCGDDCELMSPVTGEVINASELRRVKGILSGLAEQSYWIVKD